MNLNEILQSNDIDLVLYDTCVESSHDFAEEIYETVKYSGLNPDSLKKEIEVIKKTQSWLKNPKIYTIPPVTKELRAFEQIINNKIHSLESMWLPKNKKRRIRIKEIQSESKNQLRLLQEEIYNARRLSYTKELRINDNNYKLLLNMIKLIDPIIKIKKDIGLLLGFHDEDKSKTSDTDEKLTATLYCVSLFTNKSSCLVTRDQDLPRLSGIITNLIGSDSFLPYNSFFRKRIIRNPFRIYKSKKLEENFELSIDSRFTNYDHEFLIRRSDNDVNESIKENLLEMWREFNPSKKEYQAVLVH